MTDLLVYLLKKALYVNEAAENPLYSNKEPFYVGY